MGWPTPQDYNEAMQSPWLNLNDRALKSGKPALDMLGLPRPMSGAFASVYQLECDNRVYAIKLFLRKVPDQHLRYMELSDSINDRDLQYTVGFQYQEEGISIRGQNYPLLRMDWADGDNLDLYISNTLSQPKAIQILLHNFRKMVAKLQENGVAHGDLQHGNILVKDSGIKLKLVDYDGMFVPKLRSYQSNELGHPNYQHPARTCAHFGPYLDNFSAWVIHTSLLCLSIDPTLWDRLSAGDDCLLFRRADLEKPHASTAFQLLENHESEQVRENGKLLRYLLMYPPEHVPPLNENLHVGNLPMIKPPEIVAQPKLPEAAAPTAPAGPVPAAGFGLPAWMQPGPTPAVKAIERKTNNTGSWPRFENYKQALNDITTSLTDLELRQGRVVPEMKGLGTNGFVFHLKCPNRHVAIKCFKGFVPDRQKRFAAIQKYARGDARRYFLDFQYQPEGIRVGEFWYPILVMDWITPTLNDYIHSNMGNKQRLSGLSDKFETMLKALQIVGIAHGDLEPDNLLIVNNDFKLIDYDSMYVPELAGAGGIETGHPAYQHPNRQAADFGPHLDNFSAWILDAELKYLKIDPQLWSQAEIRSQVAVARTSRNSIDYSFLDVHASKTVRHTGDILRKLLDYDVNGIPTFNAQIPIFTF